MVIIPESDFEAFWLTTQLKTCENGSIILVDCEFNHYKDQNNNPILKMTGARISLAALLNGEISCLNNSPKKKPNPWVAFRIAGWLRSELLTLPNASNRDPLHVRMPYPLDIASYVPTRGWTILSRTPRKLNKP
jgi:hypothetical protein